MKRQRVCAVLPLLLALALLLSGCGEKRGNLTKPANASFTPRPSTSATPSHTPEPEETMDPETMDLIKYNAYINLNNELVELNDSIYNYFRVVADQPDFAMLPDTDLPYAFKTHSFNTDCIEDAAALAAMEPSYGALDDLVLALEAPTTVLMETMDQVHDSNITGSSMVYAENQYEKPKAWHALIYENLDAYEAVVYDFFDALTELAAQRSAEAEQQMLDEGNLIIYNASHTITVARQVLDECTAQGINDANLTQLDLTNIRTLREELSGTIDSLNAAFSDPDQRMKESMGTNNPFSGINDRLLQALDWLIKQVESGQPLDRPGEEILGSIVHYQICLARCIDEYNSVFAS